MRYGKVSERLEGERCEDVREKVCIKFLVLRLLATTPSAHAVDKGSQPSELFDLLLDDGSGNVVAFELSRPLGSQVEQLLTDMRLNAFDERRFQWDRKSQIGRRELGIGQDTG